MQTYKENILIYVNFVVIFALVLQIIHNMTDVRIKNIMLKTTYPEFSPVQPGKNHAVLFEISTNKDNEKYYKPIASEDKWDNDHVKLPCSDHNVYSEGPDGETKKKWNLIMAALSKKINSSQDFLDAVLTYQTDFKDIWKFKALHKFVNEYWNKEESKTFFEETVPGIVNLVLMLPELIQSPIPLLKQGQNKSISFTQHQLASLLANAFFCTFPERNNKRRDSEYKTYPPVNFNSLFDGGGPKVMEKLKCICHYFKRVCSEAPSGIVTFSRRHVPIETCPDWGNSLINILEVPLYVDSEALIEDADGCVQVDFANKYIGGGVLRRGAVQEEIRFVSNPELIVSLLFTEVMSPTEAVMILGTERYSTHTGYSMSFKWASNFKDNTEKDSSGRKKCAILALDARRFPKPDEQYTKEMVDRELNKAYTGFSFPATNGVTIATGNWGCGAFGGSAHLKSLLQLMACAHSGTAMSYFTFGDTELKNDIINMYNYLVKNNVKIGELYQHILQFCEQDVPRPNLYEYLKENIYKR